MNILELCLSPALGGLELYPFRTSKVLSKTDTVIGMIHKSGRLKTAFEEAGLSYRTESVAFRPLPLSAARRVASVIDRESIDVIHVHWGKDLALAAFSKGLSKRKPRLIYTRQMKMTRSKKDLYHSFLYGQMDRMLTITDKLADEAKGFLSPRDAKKVSRLYYGVEAPRRILSRTERIEMRRSLGIDKTVFLAGLFGRIEKEKGQYLLVDALGSAKVAERAISGLIVGHAMREDYLMQLKRRVDERGLQQRIAFQAFVDHPQDWMQICDCVVLATHEETFGLVLAEAMRAGIAVIGSNRGGVPEIITHEKTGLMFRSGDSEDLYRCLRRLEENPALRARLAAAGKEKADRLFDPEAHYRALRECMAGGSSRVQSA